MPPRGSPGRRSAGRWWRGRPTAGTSSSARAGASPPPPATRSSTGSLSTPRCRKPLPLDRAQNLSYSADGSKALYVRRGNEDYYWKRYKGGQYPDIWMADFAARSFTPVTDYVGRNSYPMWVGDTMFFGSDRAPDGITNLWAQDLKTGAVRQVTRYTDFDVTSPSTDGKRIVYVQAGSLHVLDPATGTSSRVPVRIPSDDWRRQERWINPAEYVHFVDVAGDGKAVVVGARGDVFHLALADKETLSSFPIRSSPKGMLIPVRRQTTFRSEYQVAERNLDVAIAQYRRAAQGSFV